MAELINYDVRDEILHLIVERFKGPCYIISPDVGVALRIVSRATDGVVLVSWYYKGPDLMIRVMGSFYGSPGRQYVTYHHLGNPNLINDAANSVQEAFRLKAVRRLENPKTPVSRFDTNHMVDMTDLWTLKG